MYRPNTENAEIEQKITGPLVRGPLTSGQLEICGILINKKLRAYDRQRLGKVHSREPARERPTENMTSA